MKKHKKILGAVLAGTAVLTLASCGNDDLKKSISDLTEKVEQLENIRKEAIEYIDGHTFYYTDTPYDLLDILKKGDNNGK